MLTSLALDMDPRAFARVRASLAATAMMLSFPTFVLLASLLERAV